MTPMQRGGARMLMIHNLCFHVLGLCGALTHVIAMEII